MKSDSVNQMAAGPDRAMVSADMHAPCTEYDRKSAILPIALFRQPRGGASIRREQFHNGCETGDLAFGFTTATVRPRRRSSPGPSPPVPLLTNRAGGRYHA
jgi:hypothetical protein